MSVKPQPSAAVLKVQTLYLPVCVLIVAGMLLHYGIALKYGVPAPTIHDEFAYLLSADTFAQGRLTNPTHPLWEYFQTFHVFFHPTYQAKFPPFQGLFLAFGQVVFGMPIWGVWLSLALAYAASYWLFLSSFKPPLAAVGTLFIVINPFILNNWGRSYWGGGVALLGGALLFGGLLHSRKSVSMANTLLMAAGVIILTNSRPYEAFVVFVCCLPMMVYIGLKQSAVIGPTRLLKRFILPLAGVGVCGILWILYYNATLTGDPLKFYYLNWDARSATIGWIQNYHGSPPLTQAQKLLRLWSFFCGPYLSIAAIGIAVALRRKQMLFEIFCIIAAIVASILYSQAWPHYLAPVTSLFYLVAFAGLYEIRRLKFLNEKLSKLIFVLVVGFYFVIASAGAIEQFQAGPPRPYNGKLFLREKIMAQLKSTATKDLVIVTYGPDHNPNQEWVYNRADIDASEVVWAHDLGEQKNARLLAYYKDRDIWQLFADTKPVRLVPLKTGEATATSH